jgi:hypothetical protein
MAQYGMTCSCGHEVTVQAKDRTEAVAKLQGMMDENAIAAHMSEKHAGEPVPSVADVHRTIAERTDRVKVSAAA